MEDSYDGWGNLADEWQNPAGSVNASGPATVQYTYDDGAPRSGTNQGLAAYLRLEDVTYLNGQEIKYTYGSDGTSQAAVDAVMSRLSSIERKRGHTYGRNMTSRVGSSTSDQRVWGPRNFAAACALLTVLWANALACKRQPTTTHDSAGILRVADEQISEEDVLGLIKRMRLAPPTADEARVWAEVANSNRYGDVRRRRAVLQLFDRHIWPGMNLSDVAVVLKGASWLKRNGFRGFAVYAAS